MLDGMNAPAAVAARNEVHILGHETEQGKSCFVHRVVDVAGFAVADELRAHAVEHHADALDAVFLLQLAGAAFRAADTYAVGRGDDDRLRGNMRQKGKLSRQSGGTVDQQVASCSMPRSLRAGSATGAVSKYSVFISG